MVVQPGVLIATGELSNSFYGVHIVKMDEPIRPKRPIRAPLAVMVTRCPRPEPARGPIALHPPLASSTTEGKLPRMGPRMPATPQPAPGARPVCSCRGLSTRHAAQSPYGRRGFFHGCSDVY